MNKLHLIGMSAALVTSLAAASGQEAAADAAKLRAYVQLPSQKPQELLLDSSNGADKFYYLQKGTDQQMEMNVASCRLFYIQTPADLAQALSTFREGNLPAARKQLAAVKTKYARYAGLPGSPVTIAAINEITAAVRMQDWAEVTKLIAAFPSPEGLTAADQARLKAAEIIAATDDTPDSLDKQKQAIAALLKDKKLGRHISSELYAWLRYALARAYAAQIPAAEQNAIPAEKVKAASDAVDNYAQCAIGTHGIAPELPADAMGRAVALLAAMPGVADYMKKADAGNMTKAVWSAAPPAFRDAAAMASLLKNVYAVEGTALPPIVETMAGYYFNSAAGTATDK